MNRDHAVLSLIRDAKALCPPSMVPTLVKIEREAELMTTEIEQLRLADSLPAVNELKNQYNLRPKEAELLSILRKVGPSGLHNDRIMAIMYSGSLKEPPHPNIIKVWVSHIRKALKAHNAPFHIETIWGWGHALKDGVEAKT